MGIFGGDAHCLLLMLNHYIRLSKITNAGGRIIVSLARVCMANSCETSSVSVQFYKLATIFAHCKRHLRTTFFALMHHHSFRIFRNRICTQIVPFETIIPQLIHFCDDNIAQSDMKCLSVYLQ